MSKPSTTPSWCTTGTRTDPGAGARASGFVADDRPPAAWLNWLWGYLCDWVTFIEDRFTNTGVTPSSGYTGELRATNAELRAVDSGGNAIPVHCGVSTDHDHALTSRAMERASAMLTTPLSVSNNTESDLVFDTQEYDTSTIWTSGAGGNRMVAPVDGYYHVSLWAEVDKGAVTVNEQYITLQHSADSRVLAKSSATASEHNSMACSIDVYLTAAQYVYARVYQKNGSASALDVTGRITMHKFA